MMPDILTMISGALGEVSRSPDLAESLAKFGNEPTFQTPEEFAARVRADIARWRPVVKESGFLAED